MSIWGGNLVANGISYGDNSSNADGSVISQELKITFVCESQTIILAWGGHIASRIDWGYGSDGKPLSAGGISGAPYHTRLIGWTTPTPQTCTLSNLGNQDRSLKAQAVVPPPTCTPEGPVVACVGATNTYSVSTDADNPVYSWIIDPLDNSANASIISGQGTNQVTVAALNDGHYLLKVTVTTPFGSTTCQVGVTVNPDLVVTCPDPVSLPACKSLEEIQTAYNAWVAGFKVSGGCSPVYDLSGIPDLPTDVLCNGADLTFTLNASNGTGCCIDDASCTSTFTVAAAADLTVTCAPDPKLVACTSAADIKTAYDAWVKGFSTSGGCNASDNIGTIPALPANAHCVGASLTFKYVVTDDCGSKDCSSTFTVAAAAPITLGTCPTDPNLPACTSQAAIETAYNAWKAGFTFSGGCNASDNIGTIPALPANAHCVGASLTFKYVVTDDCGSKDCSSTFTVAAAAPITLGTCPTDPNLPACTSQAAIETAYNAWKAGFTFSGGCNASDNIGTIPALPANAHCVGASLTFKYVVTDDCGSKDCSSTFTVAAAAPITLGTCPTDPNLPACTSQAAIETAYNAWKAGFTFSGGCNASDNIGTIPALPANAHCVGASLTFKYVVTDDCGSKDCSSTFTVAAAAPITLGTCPTDPNLPACTSQAAIETAYNAWKAGFTFSGGCNASDNIGTIPALPTDAHCNGASLTFKYIVTDDCGSKDCTSTFDVAKAPPIVLTAPANKTVRACDYTREQMQTLYETWLEGVKFSGGCNPGVTNNAPAFEEFEDQFGASVTVTWTAKDLCSTKTASATFTIAPCGCETAYGKLQLVTGNGTGTSRCFIEDKFKDWGWTTLLTGSGPWSFDLWSGAAQCLPAKGTLVGHVDVTKTGTEVIVHYYLNDGFGMSEAHVYVGSNKYPIVKGKPTVAPGQYTKNSGALPHVSEYEVRLPLSSPLNIIIHGIVCKGYLSTVGAGMSKEVPVTLATEPVSTQSSRLSSRSYQLNVYPNPFATNTTFELRMNEDSNIRLEIFSNSGMPLEVLLNENLKAGDVRTIAFDATQYPHTSFMYRIIAGNKMQSGTLLKTK